MKIYKRNPRLHGVYKDGAKAHELGVLMSANPKPLASNDYWAWQDGWNKSSIDSIPKRGTLIFNASLTDTDPGLANVGFGATNLDTPLTIRFNATTVEGSNIMQLIDGIAAGEVLVLYNKADPTNYGSYNVTSQTVTTYATVAVTARASNGVLFPAATQIVVQVGV